MNPTLISFLDVMAKHGDAHTMAAKVMPLFVGYMGADNGSLMLLSDDRVLHKVLATKETFTEVSGHKVRTVLSEGLAGWSLRHRQGGLASDTTMGFHGRFSHCICIGGPHDEPGHCHWVAGVSPR
jgi:hypothetical protein